MHDWHIKIMRSGTMIGWKVGGQLPEQLRVKVSFTIYPGSKHHFPSQQVRAHEYGIKIRPIC